METKEEKYIRAAEQVRARRKYYGKLVTFGVACIFFIGLNYYLDALRNPWFLWIVGFWGLGLAIEAFKIFGTNLVFGKNWEERKIKELMDKDMQEQKNNRSSLYK